MKSKKLELINESAYRYYCSQQENFNNICKPLELLGIKSFGYSKIFSDGKYLQISNNHDHTKNFLLSINNVGIYFEDQLNSFGNTKFTQFFLPNDINLYDKSRDHVINLSYDHNFWNIWQVSEKSDDMQSIISYYFSMTRDSTSAYDFYIKNNHLLHKFIKYFKETATDIIDTNDKSKLAHFNQSFDFHGKSDDLLFDEKVQEFLQKIEIDKKLIQGKDRPVKLTDREIKCLDYLSLGYGMKGVANILNLSPRTVEYYISNAKLKTGYNNKQLLLTQFIKEFKNR